MMMLLSYENLDLDGASVAEAIAALQTWLTENPDAVDDTLYSSYDGESSYIEICFQRPMTEEELNIQKIQQVRADEWQEKRDLETYNRLKAKFEGN